MFQKILLLQLPILMVFLLSLNDSENTHHKEALAANQFFIKKLDHFENNIYKFKSTQSKDDFLRMRIAYKQCEFLLYYSDNLVARSINGPNITVNEYDSLNPNEEHKAHGLQVIESYLYNPEAESRQKIDEEVQHLLKVLTEIKGKHEGEQKSDFALFNVLAWDAYRQELFRLEAMGITGFDTPECGNALPESIAVLQSLKQFVKIYRKSIPKQDYKLFSSQLDAAIAFIQKNLDFNSFDRLTFLRTHLHPLSAKLNQLRQKLNFSFPSNVRPINNDATHLFDPQLLNDTYFNNASTEDRVLLGKLLFNDSVLSLNNSRSCTTCHHPDLAYSDGKRKNTNFAGTTELLRNTPSLINAGWQTRFFYDSRVKSLEKQAVGVIHNPLEMGGNLKDIVAKIKNDDKYIALFMKAYKGNINETTIVNALSAYINSLRSFNARIDQYLRGEDVNLSEEEKSGFNLFMGKAKCATCHYLPLFNGLVPPFFTETESEKIGVPRTKENQKEIDTDFGRYGYTHLELHRYAFKTPSLRAISKTAPYMHNGVFQTLEEVIDFYNKGGGAGQGMNFPDQTLPADSLGLSKKEQQNLIEFLKSL